jgi:hypothetical protein
LWHYLLTQMTESGPAVASPVSTEPDLESKVASLSTRLLQTVDRQVELEEEVQFLRRQLNTVRRENIKLEDDISQGLLVSKDDLDAEREKRVGAEQKSQRLQNEIEELTGSLFGEANKMVEDARRETAEIIQKNEHLQKVIDEKNVLLDNMQQQLSALKEVIQEIEEKEIKEVRDSQLHRLSNRRTVLTINDPVTTAIDDTDGNHSPPPTQDIALSTILHSIQRPFLRRDTSVYNEFDGFLRHVAMYHKLRNSSPALSSRPATPDSNVPLKEFKVFKRSMSEDIDPTLRLDQSPHLSWLARRTVMSSIIDGIAVVEPISGVNEGRGSRMVATKADCMLCGETRDSAPAYWRLHNLKVGRSDDKTAGQSSGFFSPTMSNSSGTASSTNTAGSQSPNTSNGLVSTGHPLCHYCLNRVRSVCDFVAFMRAIRDQVWKAQNDQGRAKAWDEFARLKERMFWARQGAVFPDDNIRRIELESPRSSLEQPIKEVDEETQNEQEKKHAEPEPETAPELENEAPNNDEQQSETAPELESEAPNNDGQQSDMSVKLKNETPSEIPYEEPSETSTPEETGEAVEELPPQNSLPIENPWTTEDEVGRHTPGGFPTTGETESDADNILDTYAEHEEVHDSM